MSGRDWVAWHAGYENPESNLSRRLTAVQACIRQALDSAPPGRIRVLSMCAGDGRDLLGAMAKHPRKDDVDARLVELNESLAERVRVTSAGSHVDVVQGDAGWTDLYVGAVPAHLVLVCGVFGNITDADVERTIAALPELVAQGGHVIWTRYRNEPDLTWNIHTWFSEHGFESWWQSQPDAGYGVGAHRFLGVPRQLRTGERLFTFIEAD
jgi:Putative methyltransferase